MAGAYLCSGCGQLMGRSLGSCPLCGSKNLVFYDSERSASLKDRQGRILGRQKAQSTPVQAYTIVVLGLSVLMGAGYFFTNHWDEIVSHPAIARTVGLLIPHAAGTSAKKHQPSKVAVAASGRPIH